MIKNIRLISIFFLFIINHQPLLAEDKIMFIDIDFVYFNSVAGKEINEKIKKRSKNFNNELNKNRKKINDQKEKLISQKNVLSENDYKKKVNELEAKVKDHNMKISSENNELNKFKNKAKNEFLIKLNAIMQEYAKQNSIEIMINKNNILIGKNELDATKDILILFDKNIKTIKLQ